MKNSKHTPEKWIETPRHGGNFYIETEKETICKIYNSPHSEANGKLIASAPELLEALKDCVEGMKIMYANRPDNKGLKQDIEKGEQAINKATE